MNFGTARSQPTSLSGDTSDPRLQRQFAAPTAVVRVAAAADLRTMAEILAASFHDNEGWGRWVLPLMQMGIYEDLRHRLRSPQSRYAGLVAAPPASTRPEEVVGTVEISLKSYPMPLWQLQGVQYPYVSNLAVRAEARRCGVARKLLIACEEQAQLWGFQDLYLHVLENNQAARSLYSSLGYRVRRFDSTWGSLWFGQPRQLFLHKRLK